MAKGGGWDESLETRCPWSSADVSSPSEDRSSISAGPRTSVQVHNSTSRPGIWDPFPTLGTLTRRWTEQINWGGGGGGAEGTRGLSRTDLTLDTWNVGWHCIDCRSFCLTATGLMILGASYFDSTHRGRSALRCMEEGHPCLVPGVATATNEGLDRWEENSFSRAGTRRGWYPCADRNGIGPVVELVSLLCAYTTQQMLGPGQWISWDHATKHHLHLLVLPLEQRCTGLPVDGTVIRVMMS